MQDDLSLLSSTAFHALSSKQVAKRLLELLPYRFEESVREYKEKGHSIAKAQRLALIDPQYVSHLRELVEIRYLASQYDMLWQSKQLKRFCHEAASSMGD